MPNGFVNKILQNILLLASVLFGLYRGPFWSNSKTLVANSGLAGLNPT